MKLKRLDIHGFKSFYHRTTLTFDDGVTAVVGPNGCGKSNIVDALKWVMGEQGPRNLRGDAMEDVIFAGSERRGPMGMCEVRLTFHNDGSAEVPTQWREVEEIAIERRMERTKGSDYLVNKQRCRLSDVQDLLAGTGVGAGPGGRRAYAIIEQGQIGRIVSAKADERRLLIEEAAGITRYRNRRRLAERKMDETRQNLERVDDIIGEVERQVKALRRQARKAERYREYQTEARRIALKAATFDYLARDAERRHLEVQVRVCSTAQSDALLALETADAQRAAAGLAERAADDAARAATDALREVEAAAREAESRLELYGRERTTLGRQLETARVDRAQGAERAGELNHERGEAVQRLAALEAEAEGDASQVEAAELARRAADRALLDARAAAERLRRQEAEEAQAIARARAERDAARRQAMDLREREAAADESRARLAEQRASAEAHRTAAEDAAQHAEAAIAAAEQAQHDANEQREVHRAAADAAQAEDRRLAEAIAAANSRLRSLEELERRREGLGEGVRAVLEAGRPGVIGGVPDLIDAPAEAEQAVASALDECIKGVVVESLDAGLAAVDFLRGRGKGRALFAAADAPPPARSPLPEVDGVRGRLADALPAGPHDALRIRLLDDAMLVDDAAAARRLFAAGHSGVVVTIDGLRLVDGALLIGGAEGADPAPLSRRREIRALRAEVDELGARRAEAEARAEAARAAMRVAREAIDAAARAAQEARVRRAEARKDVHRAEGEQTRLEREEARLAEDRARLLARAEEAEGRVLDAEDLLATVEEGRVDRQRAITAAHEAVLEAEHTRDEAVSTLHLVRTRAVAREERIGGARAALARLDRLQRELLARAERAAAVEDEVQARLVELGGLETDSEQARAEALSAAETRAAVLADARARHADATAATKAAEAHLAERRRARDAAKDALGEARIALNACALRLEAAEQRLRDRYHVGLGDIVLDFHQEAPPGPDEQQRLAELEELIEKMGDVNLSAIEEFAEVSERFDFLTTQRADLTAALADLTQAIDQIDRTSRRLFKETFEAVNAHFRHIFPRLFRGGEAELLLTEPDNLLETGIEMQVSPPGKKVQNVALLSGGEKAMCALALVFAVFHFKPSPFCLLDEVDAPLDDANIGRFNEVVREMAETSQVLLITHNKRTMEIADVMYGITMEESGVSKLVGVRMT